MAKKAFMYAMQQFYNNENLNKINFLFCFLKSAHRFRLFVAFIERLMLVFNTISRGGIACYEQLTIKLCVNVILFFLFTCFITI